MTLLAAHSVDAASVLGIHASVQLWRPDLEGNIGQRSDTFSFDSEFNSSGADSESIRLAVEHFVPVLPNFMFRRTPLEWTGQSQSATGTLSSISLSGQVNGLIDLTATDATFYYEILDNWGSLDIGATLREFKGVARMSEATGSISESLTLKEVIPMLYGAVRVDLPFTGLAAGVRGNISRYSDNELLDAEAYVHLEVDLIPLLDFGIEAGVRRLQLTLDDLDSLDADAELSGSYVAITARF